MRVMILFGILISSITLKAQTPNLPVGFMNYIHPGSFANNPFSLAGTSNKKWFLSSYTGISTGFLFYNGGSATTVSVPVGLQLNRRLNENLYAFAGVSAAPAYLNFNGSFLSSDPNKSYLNNGIYKSGAFGTSARAELGLMYINDAKTFSISGSVGVQRSSYPFFPYQQMNRTKQSPVTSPNN